MAILLNICIACCCFYCVFGETSGQQEIDVQVLVEDALDYGHYVGLIHRAKDHLKSSDLSEVSAMALFPSPFPRQVFEDANNVQEALAELYFRVANDYEFLMNAYREVRKVDKTVDKLMNLLEDIRKKGIHQPIGLMMMRADYMANMNEQNSESPYEIKQIEVNIGAVGGATCEKATLVHRRVLAKAGMTSVVLPDNNATDTLSMGMYQAWKTFNNEQAIIVTIIGKLGQKTQYEMRKAEYKATELSGGKIRTVCMNLTEANEKLTLDDNFNLRLDDQIVAVVNYRLARNIPEKFLTDEKIDVWTKMEVSTAIKSPPLNYEIACTKKMQQVLAEKDVVEKFFPEPKDAKKVAAIRKFQARMWSLDHNDEKTQAVIQDAIEHPDRYVLKPNKDGGGNNLWEAEMKAKLEKLKPEERSQYILMQRIRPFVGKNFLKRPLEQARYEDQVVTELSIFGALLGNQENGKILHNKGGGHMMRSKPKHVNEGGLEMGAGFYDSPLLI